MQETAICMHLAQYAQAGESASQSVVPIRKWDMKSDVMAIVAYKLIKIECDS